MYVLLLIISTCVFLRTYSLWESLGKSDDHMPTLIILIVLVLKLESLLYDGILIAVSSIKR